MTQLEQWKANHQQGKIKQFVNEMNRTNNLASDGRVSANAVHPNTLKIEPVKNCESAKRFTKNLISPQTLVNTGVVNENCETLKQFAKRAKRLKIRKETHVARLKANIKGNYTLTL